MINGLSSTYPNHRVLLGIPSPVAYCLLKRYSRLPGGYVLVVFASQMYAKRVYLLYHYSSSNKTTPGGASRTSSAPFSPLAVQRLRPV